MASSSVGRPASRSRCSEVVEAAVGLGQQHPGPSHLVRDLELVPERERRPEGGDGGDRLVPGQRHRPAAALAHCSEADALELVADAGDLLGPVVGVALQERWHNRRRRRAEGS